jgi:hypothetical protein
MRTKSILNVTCYVNEPDSDKVDIETQQKEHIESLQQAREGNIESLVGNSLGTQ